MNLFGRAFTVEDLARHVGTLDQVAGARLVELADGVERGVRVVEMRTGTMSFDIHVDRGFDIGHCESRSIPLAFRSPAGTPGPWYSHGDPVDFLRMFAGGLLVTAGLDHVGAPAPDDAAERYRYPLRGQDVHPMHGRVSALPARLCSYGTQLLDGVPTIVACGEIRQASLFGERLVLRRRISAVIGERRLRVEDVVTNEGYEPAPHAVLYHLNFGFPLVDAGAEIVVDGGEVIALTAGASLQTRQPIGGPRPTVPEEVVAIRAVDRGDGTGTSGVVNRALGVGVYVSASLNSLPWLVVWRCLREGTYVVGLEPSAAAPNPDLKHVLEPGEARSYSLEVGVIESGPEFDAMFTPAAA